MSQKLGTTLLANVPLDPGVRAGGDSGLPVVLAAPNSAAAQALRRAAEALAAKITSLPPPPVPMTVMPDPDLRIIN